MFETVISVDIFFRIPIMARDYFCFFDTDIDSEVVY